MKNTILFLIANLILSFTVFAHEEILVVTDNDYNSEIYKLVVEVDSDTQSLKTIYKDTYAKGAKIKRETLNPEDLKTSSGVILEVRKGYNILNLKSDNFDFDLGGTITVDTLYSGISKKRIRYDFEVAKDKLGWKLFKNNKVITKFHVWVNRKPIVGPIGIKYLTME